MWIFILNLTQCVIRMWFQYFVKHHLFFITCVIESWIILYKIITILVLLQCNCIGNINIIINIITSGWPQVNQLTKQRVLCKSHHWTCSKGFLTVKAAASGDGLLAIHDRYAFQNIATIWTKPLHRNKCKIQSLCNGPDLVICDQCLHTKRSWSISSHVVVFLQVSLTHWKRSISEKQRDSDPTASF